MPKQPPIATREYAVRLSTGRSRPVVVSIYAPVLVLEYQCRITISGLTSKLVETRAHGEDGVQALELALLQVGRLLIASRAFKSGRVLDQWGRRLDPVTLGLPLSLQQVMRVVQMFRPPRVLRTSKQLSPSAIEALTMMPGAMEHWSAEILGDLKALRRTAPPSRRSVRHRSARRAPRKMS